MLRRLVPLLILFCSLNAIGQQARFTRVVPSAETIEMFSPKGLAIDSEGKVYLSNPESGGIQVYNAFGEQVELIKSFKEDGMVKSFQKPTHLFVDASDKLYVFDEALAKVIVVSKSGKSFSFGEKGSQAGQIDGILGLVADDQGYVYLLNGTKKRIDIFQPDGVYLTWISGGFDPFKNPLSISINGKNEICILEGDGPSVVMFDVYGNQVNMHRRFNKWEGVSIEEPISIAAFGNGDFMILDGKSSTITQFTRAGEVLGVFGARGNGSPGTFINAQRIVGSSGKENKLLVLDEGAKKVCLFDISFDSNFKAPEIKRMKISEASSSREPNIDLVVASDGTRYGIPFANREVVIAYEDTSSVEKFAINGGFKNVSSLAIDADDNIFVADRQAKEIQMFNSQGVLIRKMGKDIPHKLKSPASIALQKNGNLILCDEGSGNIQMWNEQGIYQKILISADNSALESPRKIQVDSKDQIYIWDEKENCIFRTGSNGWPLEMIRLRARAERVGETPGKIADFIIDPLDQIYVLNSTTSQIEIYVWDVDPEMRFSMGVPGNGPYGLDKIEQIVLDKESFLAYGLKKGGEEQKLIQFMVKPPPPDPTVTFNSSDGQLILAFNKSSSRMVTGYALVTKGIDGRDSIAAQTNSSLLNLDETGLTDLRLRRYDFVTLGKSDFSDPAVSFENHLGYGRRLLSAGRYDEALMAFNRSIEEFGAYGGLLSFVVFTLSNTSVQLANNAEAGRGLAYILSAYDLAADDKSVNQNAVLVLTAYFEELANRGDLAMIISEADELKKKKGFKRVVLDAINELCAELGKRGNTISVGDALSLGRVIHNWDPSSPNYTSVLAINSLELFRLKEMRGVPALELEAILNSGVKYAEHAIAGLKENAKPHFNERITQLRLLNAALRFDQSQALAVHELNESMPRLTPEQLVALRMELSEAYLGQGNPAAASAELRKVLEIEPDNRNTLLALGGSLMEEGKLDEALDKYKKLLNIDAENAEYTAMIGRVELLKGNFPEAAFQLEKAVNQNPADRSFYGDLARAFEGASNYNKALENYQIAAKFQEDMVRLSMNRVNNASEKSKVEEELIGYWTKLAELNNRQSRFGSAIEMYEKIIELVPDRAEAYFGLGGSSLKSGLIYDALAAFEKAKNLAPKNPTYAKEYELTSKLKAKVSANESSLSILEVKIDELFPSLYKNYAMLGTLPVGEMILANNSDLPVSLKSITVFVKELMSQPSQVQVPALVGYSNARLKLTALFDDGILKYTEDKPLEMEVVVEYTVNGKTNKVSRISPFVLHGRNSIVWSDKKRLAAFVDPSVTEIIDYIKQSDQLFKEAPTYGLNSAIHRALKTYTLLHTSNMVYSPDPIQDYALVSTHPELVDYLQYPLETLQRKGGDCDDLVALYCSLLENSGVPTAYIDVPGHVLMAFDSGLKEMELEGSGLEQKDVVIYRGEIWIPIETTVLGKHGFAVAWRNGAKRYYDVFERGEFPELVPMAEARKTYMPSIYIPEGYKPKPESANSLEESYISQLNDVLTKLNQGVLKNLESRYQTEPGNTYVKNRYASLLAKVGQTEKAERILEEALANSPSNPVLLNNLGNICLLNGRHGKAINFYTQASNLDREDPEILINLCKAYLMAGDKKLASSSFDKAVSLNSELSYLYDELKTQLQ